MVAFRSRKPRHDAVLRARIRGDQGWAEVIVCNVSEGGLMLKGAVLPRAGDFIEIRLGQACITAQVRWSRGSRCGVRSRERIDVAALLGWRGRDAGRPDNRPTPTITTRRPTPEERAAQARIVSRWINSGLTLCLVAALLAMVYAGLSEALNRPFDRISRQLGRTTADDSSAGQPGR